MKEILVGFLFVGLLMTVTFSAEAKTSANPEPKQVERSVEESAVKTFTAKGTLTGRIDSNSVEISFGKNDFQAFRLNDQLKKRFDKGEFADGQKVFITYRVDEVTKQNLLLDVK